MTTLGLSLLLGLLGFLLIAGFMLWLTNRTATAAITDHFRDAEYIVNQHEPPPHWKSAEKFDRLDKLIVYFENSPLVADQETRDILINSLTEERQRWQDKQ